MGLHILMTNVWLCDNDPKVITHAFALPPGVNERIGAVLSELPGHIALAYDVPNGIVFQMSQRITDYSKESCVRGADFGNADVFRYEPHAPVFVSDIHMST